METTQTILHIKSSNTNEPASGKFVEFLTAQFAKSVVSLTFDFPGTYFPLHHCYLLPFYEKSFLRLRAEMETMIEKNESVMVVFSYDRRSGKQKNRLSDILQACRDLRIPYIGIPEDGTPFTDIKKIALPIGFLIEEKEKAPWGNVFCQKCNATIEILQPNDHGKRAKKNVAFIHKILASSENDAHIFKSSKSSFKIEFDAISRTIERGYNIVFISGSREYTLDDIFFRPKEFHVLWKSDIPILIINPRDDIYVLCGD